MSKSLHSGGAKTKFSYEYFHVDEGIICFVREKMFTNRLCYSNDG